MSLRILSLSVAGSTLTVNFSTSGDLPAQGADLIAVLADDSDRSSVLRGENSGQHAGTCRRSPIHYPDSQGEGCRRTDGADPDSALRFRLRRGIISSCLRKPQAMDACWERTPGRFQRTNEWPPSYGMNRA